MKNSFFNILELVIKEPMTIVFTIGAMVVISFKLTLFVFIFIPISGLIISRIGKSLKAKSILAQQENGVYISVLDETGLVSEIFKNTENTTYTILSDTGLEIAKELVKAKEDFGLLYIEKANDSLLVNSIKFFSDESPSLSIMSSLERKLEKKLSDLKLQKDGVDIEKIQASKTNSQPKLRWKL